MEAPAGNAAGTVLNGRLRGTRSHRGCRLDRYVGRRRSHPLRKKKGAKAPGKFPYANSP